MLSNRGIYCTAWRLVEQRGIAAGSVALEAAVERAIDRQMDGAAYWLRVMRAIEQLDFELLETRPDTDVARRKKREGLARLQRLGALCAENSPRPCVDAGAKLAFAGGT